MDGFTTDTVKIDVSINNKKRTFNITNPTRLSPTIDISNVELDEHGHPKKESIIEIIDDIASGIHNSWGGKSIKYESSTLIHQPKDGVDSFARHALAATH